MAKGYKPCAVWDWKIMSPNSGYNQQFPDRQSYQLLDQIEWLKQKLPDKVTHYIVQMSP
jgi:hypothetical protein